MAKKKAKGAGGGGKTKGPNNRTIEKKKQKLVEEATFGLKNKNKSKKIQKQIGQMKAQVMQPHKKKGPDPLEERKLKKQRQKEKEALNKMLFNPDEDPKKAEARKLMQEQQQQEQDSDATPSVNFEDMTIEERIDYRREKVEKNTKVTKELFFKWLEQNKKQNEKDSKKKKKKGGKQALTGLALLAKDASIFIDDNEAADADAYEIKEEALDDIDEDLFADDEEEQREYDPATWTEKKTPKELLLDYCQSEGHPAPQFKPISVKGGQLVKVVIPHLDNEEFVPLGIFKNKKLAEHNAALMAYDNIMKGQ